MTKRKADRNIPGTHFYMDRVVRYGPFTTKTVQQARAKWYGVPIENSAPVEHGLWEGVEVKIMEAANALPDQQRRAVIGMVSGLAWWVIAKREKVEPYIIKKRLNTAVEALEGQFKKDGTILYMHICFLSKAQRQAMQLWLEGFTPKEIAGRLHLDRGTVRKRLYNARKTLRRRIKYGPLLSFTGGVD